MGKYLDRGEYKRKVRLSEQLENNGKKTFFYDFIKGDYTRYVVIAPNRYKACQILIDNGINPKFYNIRMSGKALMSDGKYFSECFRKLE